MSKLRVLEIIAGFAVEGPLGGIERFGIELAKALNSDSFEIVVCGMWRFGTPYESRWENALIKEGIEAFSAAKWDETHPYRSFFKSFQGTLKRLSGCRFDIVHSHCPFGDVLAILLAPFLKFPVLLRTVHNEREWPKRPLRRLLLTNLLYPLVFAEEIGVSRKVQAILQSRPLARLLRKKSRCIYNAIDLKRFSKVNKETLKTLREELGIAADAPLVISAGRLTPQKGYNILLRAVPLVLTEVPSTRFIIAGSGELEKSLKNISKELGVEHAVTFIGPRTDIENLLASADLFVSSSLWEGLPTVILESMAAKVPVVATDVSGTVELVRNGETGLLVPPGDAQALAQGIVKMLTKREWAIKMADRAYNHVQTFSIEQIAQQYARLYASLRPW